MSCIGTGGTAAVWLALNPTTGSPVAIKLLHAKHALEASGPSPTIAERFLREARILQGLTHPGIVRVLEVIEEPARGVYAFAMEKLDGKDLAYVAPRLGLVPILNIFALVTEALSAVHAGGIIHRDIKLSNIFVCRSEYGEIREGAVKVIDFGTAKDILRLRGVQESTAAGRFVGTVETMAPESCRRLDGEAVTLAPHVDQWGVGIALFHAITGKLPFQGTTVFGIMHQILSAPCPRLPLLAQLGGPEWPVGLEAIVRRCLEKDAEQRYATMAHLTVALRALIVELEDQTVIPRVQPAPATADAGTDPELAARPAPVEEAEFMGPEQDTTLPEATFVEPTDAEAPTPGVAVAAVTISGGDDAASVVSSAGLFEEATDREGLQILELSDGGVYSGEGEVTEPVSQALVKIRPGSGALKPASHATAKPTKSAAPKPALIRRNVPLAWVLILLAATAAIAFALGRLLG